MSGQDRIIHRVLEKNLQTAGYDLLDFIHLPGQGNRIMQARTLEETLHQMDLQGSSADSQFYIVRVRPQQVSTGAENGPGSGPETGESAPEPKLYLTDGSLNAPFLEHNAEVLISNGEFSLARKVYQSLLQSGIRTGQALYGIGLCFEKEGKFDLALQKYEESASYSPTIQVFLRIAGILVQQKKERYAAEIVERALNIKEISADMRFELHKTAGNCWLRIDRYEEADRHFFKALELRPSADEVRSNLGSSYLKQRRMEDARRVFQDAVASNSSNDKAQFGLGVCFEYEKRKRDAYEAYASALEVNISNAGALYGLMRLAYELKNYAKAEKLATEFTETQPISIDILFSLAGLRFHLGKIEEARKTVAKIEEMRPGYPGVQELVLRMSRY